MIDLTPLDVRNKRGDFKKLMRGYDPQEVDVFLEMTAERLEALVRENLQMRDRLQTLQGQVDAQAGREQAVQDALVTAQELRKDIREQAQREADHLLREAESEARRLIAEAETEARTRVRSVERQVDHAHHSLQELERRRVRFLQEFRALLQRELDVVEVEEHRAPVEDRTIDLDLGSGRGAARDRGPEPAGEDRAEDADAEVEAQGMADEGSGRAMDGEGMWTADVDAEAAAGTHVEPAADVGGEDASDQDSPDRPASPDAWGSRSGAVEAAGGPAGDAAIRRVGERSGMRADGPGADGAGLRGGHTEDAGAVDVADLQPEGHPGAIEEPPPAAPPDRSLELEARESGGDSASVTDYPDVPDLETVLAEAGMDEVRPPPPDEVASPRATRRAEDSLILFDQEDELID